MKRGRLEFEEMGFVSKEDFGDVSQYSSLSPLDWLAIVAEKASEKESLLAEKREDSDHDDLPSPAKRPLKIMIKASKKTPLPFDLNLSDMSGSEGSEGEEVESENKHDGVFERPEKGGVLPGLDVEERPLPFEVNGAGNSGLGLPAEEKTVKNDSAECADQVMSEDEEESQEKTPTSGKWPGPNPPPELPQEVLEKVAEMGGQDPTLLIQMVVTKYDMMQYFGRLEMVMDRKELPLTGPEKHDIMEWDSRKREYVGLNVRVIEPEREGRLMVSRLNLKRIENLRCYYLTDGWNDVRESSGLKVDDVLQVWYFRIADGNALCLALVKVN